MAWCRSLCGKAQFIRRLRVRAGFPPLLSVFTSPFDFDLAEPVNSAPRWDNIEQLEAVVEFYVNFRTPAAVATKIGDPWAAGAVPLDSSDPNYDHVNLGLLQGGSAKVTAVNNVVKLDDDADLQDVTVNPSDANNPFIPGLAAAGPNLPRPRKFLFDTIRLEADTKRTTKLYRIMAVDNQTKEVTLDEAPTLNGSSSDWTLFRRPILVLIDPIGARRITATANPFATTVWLGTGATIEPADVNHPTWTVLKLNPPAAGAPPPLDRINALLDTIYLDDDSSAPVHPRPARTYRIMKVYPGNNRTIAIEGTPTIPAAPNGSAWHIPAGLNGVMPAFEHNLNPGAGNGWDQYDGLLFAVHDGKVHQIYRFTSYTSRRQAGQNLSSARGNRRYGYSSFRSNTNGAQFRNYNLKIVDAVAGRNGLTDGLGRSAGAMGAAGFGANDLVSEARFYFGTQPGPGGDPIPNVTRDPNGKTHVRFHRGNRNGVSTGTGSAGCNVSPDFVLLRTLLVKLYESDFRRFYGVSQANLDSEVHKLNFCVGVAAQQDLTNGTSERRHADIIRPTTGTNAQLATSENIWGGGGGGLAGNDWDDKLRGNVWIVRPEEPPLS